MAVRCAGSVAVRMNIAAQWRDKQIAKLIVYFFSSAHADSDTAPY